jgi:protein gp37
VSTATSIEWTEATWSPTTGCDRISPGCDHCYALTLAGRLKAMGQAKFQRDGDPRTSGLEFGVTVHPDALLEPTACRIAVQHCTDLDRALRCLAQLEGAWRPRRPSEQEVAR